MDDPRSAGASGSLPPIVRAATSAGGTFLAILVGLLTANNHPTVVAWVVGAAAALAAGVLTFLQGRGADREITDLRREVAMLRQPSVELLEPSEGAGSQVPEMKIRGRVLIQGLPGNAVGSILKDRGLKIVPFVKPMTTTHNPSAKWFTQNIADIDEANGEFWGSVRIGSQQYGVGEDFRIILTILPRGYIPKTDTTFDELPTGVVAFSDPRTVIRLG
jgi:hypothetical protein